MSTEPASIGAYQKRLNCPCCGASVARAAKKAASSPPAETLDIETHSTFLSGYTTERVFFTYVECGDCGAKYCPVYYSQEQLDQLYSRQAENMAEAPLEARQRTQAEYARLLVRYSRMAGNYLEIGADIGLFAEACATVGRFDHFWLYEPNQEVHGQVAARFRGRNHTIAASNFRAADVPAGSLSTVTLIHVLDHLPQPHAFLREIMASLEPGGVLFTVTHDSASLLARALGRRWPPYTLQHPHLFSPRSITRLMQSAGFEVLEIAKSTNYFPLPYLIRAGLTVLNLPNGLVPNWQAPLVGLKLGNIAMIARKPEVIGNINA
jgi:2-polyprenyl-3-methyl-5-hydroxy-6-metoxy-1,4-benzoquinol methylase